MSIVRTVGIVMVASFLIGVPGALAGPPASARPTAGSPAGALNGARQAQGGALPAAPENPYVPPACSGIFSDVACPSGFAVKWIEQFYNDGITAGCGTNPLTYCPDAPVTRAQMAVFVEKAMRGTGNWSPGDLGNYNTGLGAQALLNNGAYGQSSTAIGYQALYTQSYDGGGGFLYGAFNTAIGSQALVENQPDGGNSGNNGTYNTAVGDLALGFNTTGYSNSALGVNAGVLNVTGTRNTFVGQSAEPAAGDLVDATAIGFDANVDASYHVRIGDTNVTQIAGQVGWSNLSDVRAKSDIRDLDLGLDFVMRLHPVSFTMKQGNGRTDMGFVAQDVEALLGDGYNVLGIGGDRDRTLSLRYTDLIAPMVKAIQEQQAQLAAKDARIAELEKNQAAQQTALQALSAGARAHDSQQAEIDELKQQVQALKTALHSGGKAVQPQ